MFYHRENDRSNNLNTCRGKRNDVIVKEIDETRVMENRWRGNGKPKKNKTEVIRKI